MDETMAIARTRAFIELNALLSLCPDLFDKYTEQEQAEHLFLYALGAERGGNSIELDDLESIMEYLDPGGKLFELDD